MTEGIEESTTSVTKEMETRKTERHSQHLLMLGIRVMRKEESMGYSKVFRLNQLEEWSCQNTERETVEGIDSRGMKCTS